MRESGFCLAKAAVPPLLSLPKTGVAFLGTWNHCSSLRLIRYLFSPKQIVLDGKGTDKSCHHPTFYAALFGFTLKVGQSLIMVGDVSCPDISLLLLLPALLVTCFSISSLFFSFQYFLPVVFSASWKEMVHPTFLPSLLLWLLSRVLESLSLFFFLLYKLHVSFRFQSKCLFQTLDLFSS